MAKIQKRNLDSLKASTTSPVRKSSYQAPVILRKKIKQVPAEYRTLKKAKKSYSGLLFFLFLLCFATLAGFAYWTNRETGPADRSLSMEVQGPDKIISGDQVTYVVKYKNLDIVPLQDIELDVRWPSGFYFDEANKDPKDENATTWYLPDLGPGEEESLEIKGQLVGKKDEKVAVDFNLQYVPENFSSNFKEKETIETYITENKLEIVIEAQDKSLVSTEEEFKIVIKNLVDESLNDIYLDVLFPDDFVVSGFGPKKDEPESGDIVDEEAAVDNEENIAEDVSLEPGVLQKKGKYWVMNLAPNAEKYMIVRGSFAVDSDAEQLLVAEVGNRVDDSFRRLARAEKNLNVVNPQFDIKLEINGKTESQTINWGDDLRYQLEIRNKSGADIKDVNITALIDGEALDWDSVDTVGKYEESKIIWTKNEDESLANWAVDEIKIFTWQLKVLEEPISERNVENIVKLNIEGLNGWEQINKPLLLSVGESISFNNGIYWDLGGRRVGSGVMPPQVGAITDYLVVWSITEATGKFDNVYVDTILPPGVTFLAETDIPDGEFLFDEETNTVSWNINDFAEVLLPTTASFMIEIEPSLEQKGESITLLNSTTLSASGIEEIVVKSKALKTSDVTANGGDAVGIVQ